MKSRRSNLLLYGLGDGGLRGLQFVTVPVLAMLLGPADFGVFSTLRGGAFLLGAVFGLGLASALTRSIAIDGENHRVDRYRTLDLVQWVIASFAGSVAAGLAVYSWFAESAFLAIRTAHWAPTLFWGAAIAAASVNYAVMLFQQKSLMATAMQWLGQGIPVVLALLMLSLAELSLTGMLWIFGVLALGQAVAQHFLSVREREGGVYRPDLVRTAFAYGLPIIPHLLSQHILIVADRFMLIDMVDESAAGVYGLAYLPATAVTVACVALSKAYSPDAYRLLGEAVSGDDGARAEAQRLVGGWMRTLVAGTCAAALLSAPAVRWVAPADYDVPGEVAMVLSVATGIHGLYMALAVPLFLAGATKRLAGASLMAALLNLGLNAFLIPRFELHGAAVSTLVAYALLAFFVYAIQRSTPYRLSVMPRNSEVGEWTIVGGVIVAVTVASLLAPGAATMSAVTGALLLIGVALRTAGWLQLGGK